MRYIKKLFIFLFIAVTTTQCTEVVEFELNDEFERVVIDGLVTTENKRHLVKVDGTTSLYKETRENPLSGAAVTLFEGNTSIALEELESGRYYTPVMSGKIDVEYTLTVAYDGVEYSATETLRPTVESDSIQIRRPLRPEPFTGEIDSSYYIYLFARERPGRGDCYMWEYFVNGEPGVTEFQEYLVRDDEFVDGAYPSGGWELYEIDNEINILKAGDSISLRTYSVPLSYNDFYLSFLLNTDFRGSPFDGPPANVEGNFSNGAIGFFRVSDVSEASLIFEP